MRSLRQRPACLLRFSRQRRAAAPRTRRLGDCAGPVRRGCIAPIAESAGFGPRMPCTTRTTPAISPRPTPVCRANMVSYDGSRAAIRCASRCMHGRKWPQRSSPRAAGVRAGACCGRTRL